MVISKEKMVYEVIILRTDGQHIIAESSTEYEKCYSKWTILHNIWKEAAKEQQPFVIEEPIVTAFSPSMIYEIRLIPVLPQEEEVKSNNPYKRQMQEQGFGKTFPNQGYDLLAR